MKNSSKKRKILFKVGTILVMILLVVSFPFLLVASAIA